MKIDRFLDCEGPVLHRASLPPSLRPTLDSAYEAGRLVRVLPGTYVRRELAADFEARVAAVNLWSPHAVIVGGAAARLTFWPTLPVREVDVARIGRAPVAPGYRMQRRHIDPDHVFWLRDVRVATPALAAIDLIESIGGDAIDTCLRSRRASLEELWTAFHAHPGRTGNTRRRQLLVESRDEPWSAAERETHVLLRRHRITGWEANSKVRVRGQQYFIDVAFKRIKLAIEIDGRLHEDDPDIFENDRYRQNDLIASGWRVLRFTYAMIVRQPQYVIATIRAALLEAGWNQ